MQTGNYPRYIVVDLDDVLISFSQYSQIYSLYSRYPLREIITTILSVSPYAGHDSELFWLEIHNRFDDRLDDIDIDLLDLYYDLLTQTVDQRIQFKLPNIDAGYYVFDKWVGDTAVVLQYEPSHAYQT